MGIGDGSVNGIVHDRYSVGAIFEALVLICQDPRELSEGESGQEEEQKTA